MKVRPKTSSLLGVSCLGVVVSRDLECVGLQWVDGSAYAIRGEGAGGGRTDIDEFELGIVCIGSLEDGW